MFGSMFLMTQYWQFVHGYTPLAGRRAAGPVRHRDDGRPPRCRPGSSSGSGTKRVVTTGLLIVTAALLALSFIKADTRVLGVDRR